MSFFFENFDRFSYKFTSPNNRKLLHIFLKAIKADFNYNAFYNKIKPFFNCKRLFKF